MKKLFKLMSLAALVAVMSACGGPKSFDFTKQEEVAKAMEVLTKKIDPNAVVLNLTFNSTADFSTKMDQADVVYYEPNTTEVKRMLINYADGEPVTEEPSSFYQRQTPENGMKFSDIDMSKVSENLTKTVEILKALDESKELPMSGLRTYSVEANPDATKVAHKFMIRAIDGTVTKGRTIETEYYELNFKADAAGEVEHID